MSNSKNIIWTLISTAGGLKKWIADEVEEQGDRLVFTWGDVWKHHEIRTAFVVESVKNMSFRFCWEEDESEDTFIELRMEKNELTDDYMLHITDFAYDDEKDSILSLWEQNLERLHTNTGL